MPELRLVDVGGVSLAVHTWPADEPTRPPVLLVHATGDDAGAWRDVAPVLARDRTVHALELRGHGASAWPGRYSVALMADDLGGVLGQLAGPELDLVGHSLGGLVALLAAAGPGAPVRRLVLEDVGMPHRRTPAPPPRPDGDLGFDWAVVEQVRPEIDTPDPAWPAVAARVAAPVLVVAGGPESFVTAEHVAELVATLPDGRSTTLGTGHEVHRAKPAEFAAAVRGFLDAPG